MRAQPFIFSAIACVLGLGIASVSKAELLVTFDDLDTPPALDGAGGLAFSHAGTTYQGITWDARFNVFGDQYRLAIGAPPFGRTRSGHYAVDNAGDGKSSEGLTLTTDMVLLGFYAGQNEYYGFGGGADQITVHALKGNAILASLVADLPDNNAGLAEPLAFVDTSQFLGLSGITGYRIDRHPTNNNEFRTQWIADDFSFRAPGRVDAPHTGLLLGLGVTAMWGIRRRLGVRSNA